MAAAAAGPIGGAAGDGVIEEEGVVGGVAEGIMMLLSEGEGEGDRDANGDGDADDVGVEAGGRSDIDGVGDAVKLGIGLLDADELVVGLVVFGEAVGLCDTGAQADEPGGVG